LWGELIDVRRGSELLFLRYSFAKSRLNRDSKSHGAGGAAV
jgi:hypothetical protein